MTLRNISLQKSLTQKRAQKTSRMVKKEHLPQMIRRAAKKGLIALQRKEPVTATLVQRAIVQLLKSLLQTLSLRIVRRKNKH